MEPKGYLISPRVAIGTAAVAVVAVVAAILFRADVAPVTKSEPVATSEAPRDAAPDAAPVADDPPLAVPPKIEGVKARAQIGSKGVELQLDVALALAGTASRKEDVRVKASCKLDGEWFSGSSFVFLRNLPAGTSVVPSKVTIGNQHVFTTLPTECHLGFEYTSLATRPLTRTELAKMCWDGTQVLDKPCTPTKSKDPSVTVLAVRVSTSRDRYRRASAGIDLEVSLDAEIKRPLADWSIEIAADCTLPDGSTHKASERVFTHDVHAGRPFTGKTWLFRRANQMIDVPQSCTVAVELADRQQLVREPVAAWCWRDGAVASGACSA